MSKKGDEERKVDLAIAGQVGVSVETGYDEPAANPRAFALVNYRLVSR